ncbi:hypothetical protein BE04_20960 [Sorangium cellulosum]|uniref:Uncharacterized protein n=1 Tax=Sorangium cellulosum TaxID=56 RepID=A0A150PR52_SORCE|nr:hypothetical protein BE04_20960 [Sorangium cellulosum]
MTASSTPVAASSTKDVHVSPVLPLASTSIAPSPSRSQARRVGARASPPSLGPSVFRQATASDGLSPGLYASRETSRAPCTPNTRFWKHSACWRLGWSPSRTASHIAPPRCIPTSPDSAKTSPDPETKNSRS